MPIEFERDAGNVAVFRISGELGKEELGKAQSECEELIKTAGSVKMLILLEGFAGWERTEGWEDASFAERNDANIEKMAIVGDAEWEDLVLAFTLQGLRPTPIKYFETDQEALARQWLDSG
jgi:hypothetical protein